MRIHLTHPVKTPTTNNTMKQILLPIVAVFALSFALNAGAQEKLPLLAVNGESYTNITVTAVT